MELGLSQSVIHRIAYVDRNLSFQVRQCFRLHVNTASGRYLVQL